MDLEGALEQVRMMALKKIEMCINEMKEDYLCPPNICSLISHALFYQKRDIEKKIQLAKNDLLLA